MTDGRAGDRWVLLLQRGDPGPLYEAAAMTAAATSLGVDVTLVWFDEALDALLAGALEEAGDRPDSPASLLAAARESGRLRSLACSASAVGASGGVAKVRDAVDEVVGWPTAVSLLRAADKAFVW